MKSSKLSLNKQTVYKFQQNARKNNNAAKCTFTSMLDISILKTLF